MVGSTWVCNVRHQIKCQIVQRAKSSGIKRGKGNCMHVHEHVHVHVHVGATMQAVAAVGGGGCMLRRWQGWRLHACEHTMRSPQMGLSVGERASHVWNALSLQPLQFGRRTTAVTTARCGSCGHWRRIASAREENCGVGALIAPTGPAEALGSDTSLKDLRTSRLSLRRREWAVSPT